MASLDHHVGQVAQKGDLICTVQDTSRLRVLVSAHQSANCFAEPGMEAKIRLYGTDGALILGRVATVGAAVLGQKDIAADMTATPNEARQDKISDAYDSGWSYSPVLVDLEEQDVGGLAPGMQGYGRIAVVDSSLGNVLVRELVRFFRTDVWWWLP
jgi:hypothetical protein